MLGVGRDEDALAKFQVEVSYERSVVLVPNFYLAKSHLELGVVYRLGLAASKSLS